MESSTFDADQSHSDLLYQPPSEAVVAAVAAAENVAQTDLPPLFDSIDPDALDSLFESGPLAERSTGTVSFSYAGHEVSVTADGQVDLEARLEP